MDLNHETAISRGAAFGAALALACVIAASMAVDASARRGIATGFADPRFILPSTADRGPALAESVRAGATYARIPIGWSTVERSPAGNPTDPSDPAYDWSRFEDAIIDADRRGLEVFVTLHSAPSWAEGPGRPDNDRDGPPGTWMPNAPRLGAFAQALARRYDGTYVPAGRSEPLPRVSLFEAWNEPNLTGFLAPQWVEGKRRPYGPRLYRRLLNAVYSGIKKSQPDAKVIAGATGPNSGSRGSRRTAPMRFMRELLCLGPGRHPKPRNCPRPARFDVLSHHPISPDRSPREEADGRDVAFQEMPRVRSLLRAAERHETVRPAGPRRPLWATELWWESSPPAVPRAPSEREQARHIADSLRVLWKQGIPVALFFQVLDDEQVGGRPRIGWGTGVVSSEGRRKASFSAARFPFVADRVSRRKVAVWTRAPAAGTLKIRVRRKRGGFRTLRKTRVQAGDVVTKRFRLRRRAKLRGLVRGETSNPWRVPRRRLTR